MNGKILEEYKLYYSARAERFKNNPAYSNSYQAEKQMSDSMKACSNLEDFKTHLYEQVKEIHSQRFPYNDYLYNIE